MYMRTSEPVDSKRAKDGQPIQFTVIQDVTVGGVVAIPRGATVPRHRGRCQERWAGQIGRQLRTGPGSYFTRPGRTQLPAAVGRVQCEGSEQSGRDGRQCRGRGVDRHDHWLRRRPRRGMCRRRRSRCCGRHGSFSRFLGAEGVDSGRGARQISHDRSGHGRSCRSAGSSAAGGGIVSGRSEPLSEGPSMVRATMRAMRPIRIHTPIRRFITGRITRSAGHTTGDKGRERGNEGTRV